MLKLRKDKKRICHNKKKYDVLLIGPLADNDIIFAEHFIRMGLKCCVLRKKNTDNVNLTSYFHNLKKEDIYYFKNILEFIKIARESRLILCFTGYLLLIFKSLIIFISFLKLPPIINVATGSDIMELSKERSTKGLIYRLYLSKVKLNWCPAYPEAIKNILELNIPNVIFMKYPYFFNEETISLANKSDKELITFFHPSNIDWGETDSRNGRKSTKGNDKFIRAFAKALKNGLNAKCIMLDRGPDKELAKKLIRELGVEKRIIWKSQLNREELRKEYEISDVVVDQFDVGGLGGISVEAMACGKPVMTYVNINCLKILYTELPPLLNCKTEEEIYEQIIKCQDRIYLQELGQKSYNWAYKNHHWKNCLDQFLFYYSLLTGHIIVDYGWDQK